MQLILGHSKTAKHLAARQHPGRHGADNPLVAVFAAPEVALPRAFDFAHADGHHFEQTAFNRAGKIRVRLHPVEHDDAVSLPGRPVHKHFEPFGGRTKRNRRHV